MLPRFKTVNRKAAEKLSGHVCFFLSLHSKFDARDTPGYRGRLQKQLFFQLVSYFVMIQENNVVT